MSLKPALMSWSGGKDSCLALFEIQKSTDYRVAALLTTLTRDYDRVSMHGVRRVLLERQAASLGFPLHQVLITKGDHDFLAALPSKVDPCGENGGFHTFVYDGPNFAQPVEFSVGETVSRDGFWFCDLLPQ